MFCRFFHRPSHAKGVTIVHHPSLCYASIVQAEGDLPSISQRAWALLNLVNKVPKSETAIDNKAQA
jgi:hypothetical protein